ncbi:MAG: helix-turn-helix domain-containing protein [Pirellulaceae bacterium]
MRYSFRLAKLVGHTPDPRKRPGTIKQICEFSNLDRHQVAALLKSEVKYIPLEAIGKLCDYLLAKRLAKPQDLPGILFALEPENFWELIARRQWVEVCMGVRKDGADDTLDDAWIVASDSVMFGELLRGITDFRLWAPKAAADAALLFPTEPPADASEKKNGDNGDNGATVIHHNGQKQEAAVATPLLPEVLRQTLVWSPGKNEQEYKSASEKIHEEFGKQEEDDKALVCIGSVKSNPVVERIIASAFGCPAFQSQDKVASATQRSVPFFLRYRDNDPHYLASCCGGWQLAEGHSADKPGIYFETKSGKWNCCPCDDKKHDAAFVFYVNRPSQGILEMALGGYSGRASRLLAQHLDRCAEKLWPPVYSGQGLEIGAFVIRFQLKDKARKDKSNLGHDDAPKIEVERLDEEVIVRRMQAVSEARGEETGEEPEGEE